MKRSDLAALVGGVYAAAEPGQSWATVIAALTTRAAAEQCSLQMIDESPLAPPVMLAAPGVTAAEAATYVAHFHSVDPFAQFGRSMEVDRAMSGQEVIAPKALLRTEYWNDFAARHGQGFHMMGARITLGGGRFALIGLLRPPRAQEFGARPIGLLAKLVPHLRAALQLRLRLEAAATDASAAALMRDALGPCAVLGADGRLLLVSPAMEVLAQAFRIGLTDGVIRIRDAALDASFASALQALRDGGAGQLLEVTPPDSAERVFLSLSRMPSREMMVLVRLRLSRSAPIRAAMLRSAFGLGVAEGEVAAAMIDGCSAPDIAAMRGTSLTTAKTQWASVLAKAGVGSLREFTALAARLLDG